ncbi:MAG: MerR family transcriptional regulator [Treponema sp.]|nr:MerR family transcriptional regulator [Treponema sp.]
MTVNEFSKIIGIPASKIRFYDRSKIIEGDREIFNNYRSFCESDALNLYNAQMLRSFNFSLNEVLDSKEEELVKIDSRVHSCMTELEKSIREQEMKLLRLKEMSAYFSKVGKNISKVTYHRLEDSYNIFTVNCDSSQAEREAVKQLAEVMPYSYICVKISKDSILSALEHNREDPLQISVGLGILESNRKKIDLTFPPAIEMQKSTMRVGIFLECEDVFNIKLSDLKPLLKEIKEKNIPIEHDFIGRVFISYRHNGISVHGLGFGCVVPES